MFSIITYKLLPSIIQISSKKVNDFLQNLKRRFDMPEFKTIRQTAARGILSEHRIRLMVAAGQCPGIKTGNRFLVNVSALAEMLDTESRKPQEVKSE